MNLKKNAIEDFYDFLNINVRVVFYKAFIGFSNFKIIFYFENQKIIKL